jgi:hypothetical protein
MWLLSGWRRLHAGPPVVGALLGRAVHLSLLHRSPGARSSSGCIWNSRYVSAIGPSVLRHCPRGL